MKICVAGTGAMGVIHMKALRKIDGVEVVSVNSRTAESGKAFAAEWGIPHYATNLEESLDRPGVDRDAAALKVDDGVGDRPIPLEAEVAAARLDRKARHLGRMKARSMQIELRGAEPVGPALRAPNKLGAEHIAVEHVRALPVRDMHHAVVECDG